MSQFFKYIYNIPLYDKLAVLIPKSQTLEFDTTDLLVSNKNKRILNKVFGSNLKNEWYNNIKKYILSKLKNDKIVIVSDYNENRGTNDDKISKDSQFVTLLFNYKNIERYYNYINYGNHVKFKNMCFIIVDFKQFFELLSSEVLWSINTIYVNNIMLANGKILIEIWSKPNVSEFSVQQKIINYKCLMLVLNSIAWQFRIIHDEIDKMTKKNGVEYTIEHFMDNELLNKYFQN